MRIQIRKWKLSDSAALAANLNDLSVLNNLRDGLPYPYTEEDAAAYITVMMHADPEKVFAFAVTLDDECIGSIGVFRCENIHRRSAELGYYIGKPHWGNGYMTVAVRLICHYVFTHSDIVRIFAEPFSTNLGSCRVLEKAGFTYEGTMRQNAYKNGNLLDMKLYSILRDERG
ncbi:MAG: GNAT family N-acetyltransferase [Oscillospiraceae bacterium]|nr:GNAT family N-acetyltransferase [Oscillospiraceae bacterium]